jgi:hypothetical protein
MFFYISNLRASLISVEREAPIDTVRGITGPFLTSPLEANFDPKGEVIPWG